MKKTIRLLTLLLAGLLLAACSVLAEEQVGEAQGYGGVIRVKVKLDGDRITAVEVLEHHETDGVGTRAIEALPAQMTSANTARVDGVSGATVTSNALIEAVEQAIAASGKGKQTTSGLSTVEGLRPGIGMCANGRLGPGTDNEGAPVYSFNVVFAAALFDAEGRIRHLDVDQLEVATPNYSGAGMPQFSGWPGQGGWALWDDAAGRINGKSGDSEDDLLLETDGWASKRARSDSYMLGSGSWASEMDAYQRLFTGKTADEVAQWYRDYCSDVTGRPLQANAGTDDDKVKWGVLTDADRTMLADVTSSATMSLRDSHGDIVTAIQRAWENAQQR